MVNSRHSFLLKKSLTGERDPETGLEDYLPSVPKGQPHTDGYRMGHGDGKDWQIDNPDGTAEDALAEIKRMEDSGFGDLGDDYRAGWLHSTGLD